VACRGDVLYSPAEENGAEVKVGVRDPVGQFVSVVCGLEAGLPFPPRPFAWSLEMCHIHVLGGCNMGGICIQRGVAVFLEVKKGEKGRAGE
jgi:hypothetical protein